MVNTFNKPIIPENEVKRVNSLRSYQILDTEPELYFDNLVQIIARTLHMPVALISLVDKDRVYFKANEGMPGTQNVSRGVSLCSLAILETGITVFENALDEPCLLANPLVAGEFGLRFYAGAPITTSEGFNIGTVCVLDKTPRIFNEMDRDLLSRFADIAMKGIEARAQKLNKPTKSN